MDPQLNRIADQVNQKIDLVEERLLGAVGTWRDIFFQRWDIKFGNVSDVPW